MEWPFAPRTHALISSLVLFRLLMKQDSVDFYKYKHSTSYTTPVQLFLLDKDLLIYTSLMSVHALFTPSYSLWQIRGIRITQVQAFATTAICQALFACQGCTSPHFYFHSVPEPLGSAYPFGSKSNTSYVPLTRKGPKCKVLVYYLPS